MNIFGSSFHILPLKITIKAEVEISLPPYAGSTLRGAFGNALKKICCVARQKKCKECIFKSSCVYVYIFETPLAPIPLGNKRLNNVPHPFVFDIKMYEEPMTLKKGIKWSFGMTLFGRATGYIPYVLAALESMGASGLGKGRGRFRLSRVELLNGHSSGTNILYDNGSVLLLEKIPILKDFVRDYSANATCITLNFVTPLRLKIKGKFINVPEFHLIISSIIRRIEALSLAHSGTEVSIPYLSLVEKAREIKIIENKTHWYDWKRYSHRQKGKMKLGGIVGSVTYKGNIAPFEPYLAIGSLLHIGKNSSFGLGKYIWKYC